jgi:Rhodopirellula transposase DDE domain
MANSTGFSRHSTDENKQEREQGGVHPASADQRTEPGHANGGRRRQDRIRRPGGGRKLTEIKDPTILTALERMLADEIAGDPMSEQKWVRSSLRRLSERLASEGHQACAHVVGRLLKGLGFSLKANQRKQGRRGCPERDAQFKYIASMRQEVAAAGLPIISVDAKKKELIGNFPNPGRVWCREAAKVDEHGFPSAAECVAVPYGVYDLTKNTGYVGVGLSHSTPEFAVTTIARWWQDNGRVIYPGAGRLLILADGGGSNGYRSAHWKWNVQEKLCNCFNLQVTVCHYPPGCSKWNPVEHRLFSQISINWAGRPLRSLEIMLGYIRGTTTKTGLRVQSYLDEGIYKKGQKIARKALNEIRLGPHAICSRRNYTISPMP